LDYKEVKNFKSGGNIIFKVKVCSVINIEYIKNNIKRRIYKVLKRKNKPSKAEIRIAKYLKSNKIDYIQEKEYRDLFNPKTKQPLRFDFCSEQLNLCIEYDGIQHFEYIPKFHGKDPLKGMKKLEAQKAKDRIKDEYCYERKIRLIRIKYLDFEKIEEILEKELNKIER